MLRVGFVGLGNRARVHLRALDALGQTRLVGVVDMNREVAQRVAAERGARVYPDVREMLSEARPDAVYVVVPFHLNAEIALPVLEAGVPLFIEKTLALRPTDARAIAAAAQRAGVPAAVGYQWRYVEQVDRLREAVPPERVGLVAGRYYSGQPRTIWGRRRDHYGGQVYAQLTHVLDLSRFLVGEVRSVQAAYGFRIWPPGTREPGFDVWDVSSVTVRYASGAVGSFHCTYGLGGQLGPGEVVELQVIAPGELWTLTATHLRRQTTAGTIDEWPNTGDPVEQMHAAFLAAVTTGRTEQIRSPVADALQTTLVCAAANRANELEIGVRPEEV